MKIISKRVLLSLSVFCLATISALAQTTAFTYQGRLHEGGNAANGSYGLQFALFDAPNGGNQIGGVLTNAATAVSNGLFTVTLDFGAAGFTGADRWLELGVSTNGASGGFQTLAPRQRLTSTPYAIQAASAASAANATVAAMANSIAASNINGTISLAQLPASLVTNGQSNVVLSGSFSGNGAGLTNLNATNLAGIVPAAKLPASLVTNGQSNVTLSGGFTGNGGGLTNLNATNLTGILSVARLPAVVVTNGSSGLNLSGAFSGNGSGVSNVNLLTVNSLGALSFTTNYGSFVLASSPTVGMGPQALAAADFNGDGKVDVMSANAGDSTLTVLTNDGAGAFVFASSPFPGGTVTTASAADVNGDGKPDLIVANPAEGRLTVLTNNGTGAFVIATQPAVAGLPWSATAADVNGDGRMDLISANWGPAGSGTNLSVLTNNGSGGFVSASTPTVGSAPYQVAAADVNGDGKVDLISANQGNGGGNTLTVLTNAGNGQFALSATLTVGSGTVAVRAADLNGDGKLDLVSVNANANTISVLTNNGTGGFVLAGTLAVGTYLLEVAVADVNADGRLDLITANFVANSMSVLTNNGNAGFALAATFAVGSGPRAVAAADVNGDGKADLISANGANGGGTTLTVLTNSAAYPVSFTGNGSQLTGLNATNLAGVLPVAALAGAYSGAVNFSNVNNSFAGNGGGLTNLTVANLSGILADSQLSPNVALLNRSVQNFSGGINSFGGKVGVGITTPGFPLSFADTLGDKLSLFGQSGNHYGFGIQGSLLQMFTDQSTSDIAFGRGQSTNFTELMRIKGTGFVGIGKTNPATALDVNGTVTATNFAGIGAGLTSLRASNLVGTVPGSALTGVAGVNLSGIFSGTFSGNGSGLTNLNFSGNAAGLTNLAASNIVGTLSGTALSGVTGVNLSGSFSGNGTSLTKVNLLNVNSQGAISFNTNFPGVFTFGSSNAVGLSPAAIVAADVNGDGKQDLIGAARNGSTITVLTNNGNGTFALSATLATGSTPQGVAAADVNGDGKVDLITANYGLGSGNTLTVFTNDGGAGFVQASSPTVGGGPTWVVAADVDGDGKADLISANQTSNTLTVLTNSGNGTFGFSATLVVGSGPQSVAAGDVNGDGRVDLVSANFSSSTLSVLTNNGSGGFVLAATVSVGTQPASVAVADVNGDGRLDLVSGNISANTLKTFTNNGSSGFVLTATLTTGTSPRQVVAADVNTDGKVDLISVNSSSATFSVFTNNGTGVFALASSPGAGGDPRSLAVADVNGDGGPDLISGSWATSTLNIYLNTPSYVGSFAGDGSDLTSLNATNLIGTVSDLQLSPNVALLNRAIQSFTGGTNSFTGKVGIGTANPATALEVSGTVTATSFTGNGAGLSNILHATSSTATNGTVIAAATYQAETTYLSSASTIASITVALPTTTIVGQEFRIHSKSAITSLSLTGGSFADAAVTSMTAGQTIAFQAVTPTGTYIRLQ